MSIFLAVDWDGTEIRVVQANLQRGLLKVIHAVSAPLEIDTTNPDTVVIEYGQSLKNLLKNNKIGRARLLLGLNRNSVEMMTFQLPPVKPDELPDLIQNQILRDSPTYSEGAPYDFLTWSPGDDEALRCIAATITRVQLKKYRSIAQTAGLRAKRIEFRPLAIAELYCRSQFVSDEPVVLVQSGLDEADILVINERKVVFLRSINLPNSLTVDEKNARLASEINRTIAVSQQEIIGHSLERVMILGSAAEYQILLEQLTDLGVQTQIVNPFALGCIQMAGSPKQSKFDDPTELTSPGRFAGLLGMILSEQSKSPDRLDFLHPREKPQPLNIARFVVLFLLLFGMIGFAAYYWNNVKLKTLEHELAKLTETNATLANEYNQGVPQYQQLVYANNWESQQLIWLDELRDISVRLPAEQDLLITSMQFSYGYNYNGQLCGVIDLTGRVRTANILYAIQQNFRDGYHDVQILDQRYNQAGGGYPWSFNVRMITMRRQNAPLFLRFLSPELQKLSSEPPNFPVVIEQQTQTVPTPTPPASNGSNIDTNQVTPTQPHVTPNVPQKIEPEQQVTSKPPQKQVLPGTYFPNDRSITDVDNQTGTGTQAGTSDSLNASETSEASESKGGER